MHCRFSCSAQEPLPLICSEGNTNHIRWIIELLLVIALILSLFIPTGPARADPGPKVPWEVDCENGFAEDGFLDREFCVPGVITDKTHYVRSPSRFYGVGSSYAPGVMEWMCSYNGGCDGYKDGVAVMSCGDVGRTAWIKIADDRPWYGPLKVVDCSQPFHAWVNIVEYGLAIEWGAKTAEILGARASSAVRVHLGGKPNDSDWGWYYRTWWLENALEFEIPFYKHWTIPFRGCPPRVNKCSIIRM